MAQRLRALDALLENLGLIPAPTFQLPSVTPVPEDSMLSFDLRGHQELTCCKETCRQNVHQHKLVKNNNNNNNWYKGLER